jgi:glycosyltransferase involved in cell wall biosynthesis
MAGKKVLEICNLDRFAASPYMLPLFKALVNNGNEVHVACTVTSFESVLEEAGLVVHDVAVSRRLSPFQDRKTYKRLKAIVAEGGFDVVHTHNPKDGVLGRMAAWKCGVPLVLHTCNGYYFSHRSSSLKRWLVLRAERFASRRCHRIIFVNSEDLMLAAARKVVAPGKARLIYNGVDLERFAPGEEDAALRGELGIGAGSPVLGFVGEIRREKNLEVLVRAAGGLLDRWPGLQVVLVGDYSLEPEEPERLRGVAEEVGLGGRVCFTGYRFDPERLYRMFDVYVLPTTREGFGVTLIEAMASSAPVVACDVRGPREVVGEREGILVKDRDPEELARAIAFLLDNPEAAERYTQRARKKVTKEFNQQKILPALLDQYEEKYEKHGKTRGRKTRGRVLTLT